KNFQTAFYSKFQIKISLSSFPRRRESRLVGTETYRVKRFLQFYVPDSRLRGDNDSGISTSNPLFIST
ncbi:hypothetical protein, partial [Neisseria gonorrhoeae]